MAVQKDKSKNVRKNAVRSRIECVNDSFTPSMILNWKKEAI